MALAGETWTFNQGVAPVSNKPEAVKEVEASMADGFPLLVPRLLPTPARACARRVARSMARIASSPSALVAPRCATNRVAAQLGRLGPVRPQVMDELGARRPFRDLRREDGTSRAASPPGADCVPPTTHCAELTLDGGVSETFTRRSRPVLDSSCCEIFAELARQGARVPGALPRGRWRGGRP